MRPLNKITHSAKLLLLLCYLPSFTLDCAAQVKSNDEIELQNLTVQRKPFDSELEQPILEEIIEFMKAAARHTVHTIPIALLDVGGQSK